MRGLRQRIDIAARSECARDADCDPIARAERNADGKPHTFPESDAGSDRVPVARSGGGVAVNHHVRIECSRNVCRDAGRLRWNVHGKRYVRAALRHDRDGRREIRLEGRLV